MSSKIGPYLPIVKGFSNCGLFNNREIESFLNFTFPKSHLSLISEVVFVNTYKSSLDEQISIEQILTKGIYIASTLYFNQQTGIGKIEIYRQQPLSSDVACTESEFLKICIAHEIGHIVYERLNYEIKESWNKLSKTTSAEEAVSQRAMRNIMEDFCESYAIYRINHDELNKKSHRKFMFFKTHLNQWHRY